MTIAPFRRHRRSWLLGILINCSGPPRALTLWKKPPNRALKRPCLSLKHHLTSGFTGFPS
jgi:hypothetical protein